MTQQTWKPRSYEQTHPQIRQMFDHDAAEYGECGNCGTLLPPWHLEVDPDSYWHQTECGCGYTYLRALPSEEITAYDESSFVVEVEA